MVWISNILIAIVFTYCLFPTIKKTWSNQFVWKIVLTLLSTSSTISSLSGTVCSSRSRSVSLSPSLTTSLTPSGSIPSSVSLSTSCSWVDLTSGPFDCYTGNGWSQKNVTNSGADWVFPSPDSSPSHSLHERRLSKQTLWK